MSVTEMIGHGRQMVARTLIDDCTITRPGSGPLVIDPVTLIGTPAAAATIYTGPCRVLKPSTEDLVRIFGDTDVSVQRLVVRLPHTAPAIHIDDVIQATDSCDAEVVRHPMRVRAVVAASVHMYRDLGVEVVT